jgi:hypothetical protein
MLIGAIGATTSNADTMMKIVLSLALLGSASAACPNGCSGHGTCGFDDSCTCYQDWVMGDQNGGDCSDRKCPYEISWVSTPNKDGYVHTYAECAGRGICDRSSGECDCFDGYTGKACGYTTCPNDCSGHGTCEFIEELTYGSVPGDYFDTEGGLTTSASFDYVTELWDYGKSRACKCDPMYTEIDCSRKMCPKGNDVLDTRMDTTDSLSYQVQTIKFENVTMNKTESFALTFKSTLNETYTTTPIAMKTGGGIGGTHDIAKSMESALLALPNGVVDGVSVNMTVGAGARSDLSSGTFVFSVYFSGTSVQGPQNKLIIEMASCGDGCTPKLGGVDVDSNVRKASTDNVFDVTRPLVYIEETVKADYNNYECGRRGKCDYDSGLCDCFEGYTGYKCQVQTALI